MNPEIKELALDAIRSGIYKKNIHWLFGPKIDIDEFTMVKRMAGSPGMSTWIIQKCYHRMGIQVQVSKDVSDDLLATDFSEKDSKIENIPWPSTVVEMYFEDPLLPTIVLMKCSGEDIEGWFPQLKVEMESKTYITALMQEGSGIEGKQMSLQLKPEMYDDFLKTAETPMMKTGILSATLSQQDNATMSFMLQLALKVFVFSSIPRFKSIPITRKDMTMGGKPGVKGRPSRPSFKTTYLPRVINQQSSPSITSNEGRDFHGRRGFVRWYNSERFVNKRGTWDFIPPVVDPHTGKYPERSIIKVRKP